MDISLRVSDKRLGYAIQRNEYEDKRFAAWTTLTSNRIYPTSLCGDAITSVVGIGWRRVENEVRELACVDDKARILIGLPQLVVPDIPVVTDFLTKAASTGPIFIQMRDRAVLYQIVNRSKYLEVVDNHLRHTKWKV